MGKIGLAKALLLLTINHGAATFDAWSTERALRFPFVTESNPLMRPFVHSKPAAYIVVQGQAFVSDWLELRHKNVEWKPAKFAFKTWEVGTPLMHGLAGIHNLQIESKWANWTRQTCSLPQVSQLSAVKLQGLGCGLVGK
jgi:hypothetical protein